MSRGALLLRAARAGRELDYASVAGAARSGPRAPGVAEHSLVRATAAARTGAELVILVGLPGAGKTTFFRAHLAASHVHVSKDVLRASRQPVTRQAALIAEALAAGRSVVVDNTNASARERAGPIAEARRLGARVTGYFFDCAAAACEARNAGREGRARVPRVAILATARRLTRPTADEGFDEVRTVRVLDGGVFDVT
jgi:predicted kinase